MSEQMAIIIIMIIAAFSFRLSTKKRRFLSMYKKNYETTNSIAKSNKQNNSSPISSRFLLHSSAFKDKYNKHARTK